MKSKSLTLWLCIAMTTQFGYAQLFFPSNIANYTVNVIDTNGVAPGYFFITPRNQVVQPSMMILDSLGNLVAYLADQDSSGNFRNTRFADFKIFPDGRMTTSFGDFLAVIDSNFQIVDSFSCTEYSRINDFHDFQLTDDGHAHRLCMEYRPFDLSGYTTTAGEQGDTNGTLIGGVIHRYDENGILEFEWLMNDHYSLSDFYDVYFNDPSELDVHHPNALVLDHDGHYLVSNRHLNEITKVHSQTGQIIWRLGGKQSSFSFLNDTAAFTAQHDIRVLPNGNYTLYDNGLHSVPRMARAVEYQLDTANWTATKVWEYYNPLGYYSRFIGSHQRLSNGNSVIDWGGGLPNSAISICEVKPDKTEALQLDLEDGVRSYRAVKYDIPFKINRPVISYDTANSQLVAPPGHTWYQWSTGGSASSIPIDAAGSYQVFVSQGLAFLASNVLRIADNAFDTTYTTNVTHTSATANWSAVPNAVYYVVRGKVAGSAAAYVTLPVLPPATALPVSGLVPGTEYEWQVQAVFADTASLFSGSNVFRTSSCPAIQSVTSFVNSPTSVSLYWEALPGSLGYLVAGKEIIQTGVVTIYLPGSNFNLFNVAGLNPGSTYVWGVSAVCSPTELSELSPTDTFTLPDTTSALKLGLNHQRSNTAYEFDIFPNPAEDRLTLSWSGTHDHPVAVQVLDLSFRTIRSFRYLPGSRKLQTLDLSGIAPGVYLIGAIAPGGVRVKKLVVLD